MDNCVHGSLRRLQIGGRRSTVQRGNSQVLAIKRLRKGKEE